MPRKSKHKILFFGIVAVVVLVGGATGFTFFTRSGNTDSQREAGRSAEEMMILPLEPLILNLSDAAGTKFLRVAVQLEIAKTPEAERLKARTPQMRDAIIMLLTAKTPGTLSSPEGKLQAKDEINLAVNQALGENIVKNVYFTDFVMQ